MKDYFEHLDELPQHIKAIIDNFSNGENDYETCQQLVDTLEQNGWTCDYTLESEPFDLKPLGDPQFGFIKVEISGNGLIKDYVIRDIRKILNNYQGVQRIYIDGIKI